MLGLSVSDGDREYLTETAYLAVGAFASVGVDTATAATGIVGAREHDGMT